jgi:hypothetical protein
VGAEPFGTKIAMPRKYDKGEKRIKHEGTGPDPEIQFFKNQPRRFVGKCPAGMSAQVRTQLLNDAIAGPAGDREIDYPKYLYVVHNGAIYEARTSDAGVTYHGFPYRGKLARQMVNRLRTMAQDKKCLDAFEDWVKKHIQT